MWVYLLGLSGSVYLLYIMEKKQWKHKWWFAVIALLIPCLIAGLRADCIGTDVQTYLKPLYLLARNSSSFLSFFSEKWWSVWYYRYVKDIEIGFLIVLYVISKLFHSLFAVQFVVELLICVPVYFGIKTNKNSNAIWLSMAVYYAFFFNKSLNMMRQGIAMAFVFCGMEYLINKSSYKKYLVCQFVGLLFHTSSLIGVIIVLIYSFIKTDSTTTSLISLNDSSHKQRIRMLLCMSLGSIIVLSYSIIGYCLSLFGLGKYSGYFGGGNLRFSKFSILSLLPIMILMIFSFKRLIIKDKKISFYFIMLFYTMIFSQVSEATPFTIRMSYYFMFFIFVLIPKLVDQFEIPSLKNQLLISDLKKPLALGYLFVYWYLSYAYMGTDHTVPYAFL